MVRLAWVLYSLTVAGMAAGDGEVGVGTIQPHCCRSWLLRMVRLAWVLYSLTVAGMAAGDGEVGVGTIQPHCCRYGCWGW